MTVTAPGLRQLLPPLEDRAEWLEWRREGIGASDVAGVLGLSNWSTPTTVWLDKTGRTPGARGTADDVDSDALWHGRHAEAVLNPWFAEHTGSHVAGAQWRVVGTEPWQRATLDGIVFGSDRVRFDLWHADALLEDKATGQAAAVWGTDGIPLHYKAQAAWQSICTGVPAVFFAVLHVAFGRLEFRAYHYEPTDSDRDFIVNRVGQFWSDHVQADTPPRADSAAITTAGLQDAWPDVVDDPAELTPELAELCERVDRLRTDAREAKAAADQAANELRAALGEHTAIVNPDGYGATWRPARELDTDAVFDNHPDIAADYQLRRLDLERFRRDHPDIAERHTDTTGARRLNITKPKKKKGTTP